jgi:hypothetical protein
MPDNYTLYGSVLSLFTRKLESALVWYGVPFARQPKTSLTFAEIDRRSGTHQMPALLTPENWMLADTTPIMISLDARFPARTMFPGGPLGVLVHLVEEYFDEWVARVMVHYRWHYAASTRFAVERMTREFLPEANAGELSDAVARAPIPQWGLRACRATALSSDSYSNSTARCWLVEAVPRFPISLARPAFCSATGPAPLTRSSSAACSPTPTWIPIRLRS